MDGPRVRSFEAHEDRHRPLERRRAGPSAQTGPQRLAQVVAYRRVVLLRERVQGARVLLVVLRDVARALARDHRVDRGQGRVLAELQAGRVEGDQRPAGERHVRDDRRRVPELPQRVGDEHARGHLTAVGVEDERRLVGRQVLHVGQHLLGDVDRDDRRHERDHGRREQGGGRAAAHPPCDAGRGEENGGADGGGCDRTVHRGPPDGRAGSKAPATSAPSSADAANLCPAVIGRIAAGVEPA